jgi:hypothetical protein
MQLLEWNFQEVLVCSEVAPNVWCNGKIFPEHPEYLAQQNPSAVIKAHQFQKNDRKVSQKPGSIKVGHTSF